MKPEILEKLFYYRDQLLLWNEHTALISASDAIEKAFFQRHIFDSLQLLSYLHRTDRKIADIGSGNGAPGLICAIADRDPQRKFTLIEKKLQKVIFLKTIISELGLKNVEVFAGDVNSLSPKAKFDILTSRAFTYAELGEKLIKKLLKNEKSAFFFMGTDNNRYDFGSGSCYVFKSVTSDVSKILMLKNEGDS